MKILILCLLLISCSTLRKPSSIQDLVKPQVNFRVDDKYLAIHTLMGNTNWNNPKEQEEIEIVNFQKKVWELHEDDYKLLQYFKKTTPDLIRNPKLKFMDDLAINSIKLKEFRPVLERTKKYLDYVKNQWVGNLENSTKLMGEITGLNFDKKFNVYITHQYLKNGTQLGKQKIGFGHTEDWPNYYIVYLWHEILHSYFGKSDLDHALIELATDNELRVRMNGGQYPPLVGHEELKIIMEKVLPKWREYLRREKKDLVGFGEEMEKNLNFNRSE
jgi:hypothetical protein